MAKGKISGIELRGKMEPIVLEPAYQNYVWGGNRIPHYFQRAIPEGRYAESWEVSDRIEGMSVVASGPKKGISFSEFLEFKKFPLLIKIIDAKENLSVQVHPDEESSVRLGGEPKTEIWIALEKSTVFAGLKQGVTKELFIQALKENSVEKLLRKFILEKGEAIFIPAGLIHAICGDSLLLEVQQNSNTTYRLYDWGRAGRELHLEKGLESVHWDYIPKVIPADAKEILSNSYFHVERHRVNGIKKINAKIIFSVSGYAKVGPLSIQKGQTLYAHLAVELDGNCELIAMNPKE
jgi:mannose-6-phosphate isomerase